MSSRSTGVEVLCGTHICVAVDEGNEKLFVLFVDFSKAYDRVHRKTLFAILKKIGCGQRFLKAIMAIYKNKVNVLNSVFIMSTIGGKQGGPMSCIFFIIYLNVLAIMMKLIRR